MKNLKLATIGFLLSCGTAVAQSPTQPNTGGPPGIPVTTNGASASGGSGKGVQQTNAPTLAQCTAGWQSGMSWTRDEFLRACTLINGTVK